MKTQTISTRLSTKEIKEIEKYAKHEDLDKSTFTKKLLHKSLDDYRTAYAFSLYEEGRVSLWKAAKIAEKSLWEMIDSMEKYGIAFQYTVEDLQEDIQHIRATP